MLLPPVQVHSDPAGSVTSEDSVTPGKLRLKCGSQQVKLWYVAELKARKHRAAIVIR